ncbi:MAG: threonine synthase [Verrucomicrobiae bacterium]|nr:threonine synthase [Verrucomicrobiae bacterium]
MANERHTLWRGVIEEYRQHLPVTARTPVITLNEGGTPLIRARRIEKEFNLKFEVYLKHEGLNPTASFKDRGMTVAVSKAVENGAKAIICASTGNTSAAAAAYAARAGIQCVVILPAGKIAMGKLAQALMYGAKAIAVEGNFDDALRIVREVSENSPIALVNSVNPHRIEGQKTAAFEICDALGDAPDFHILPVGNAGNITAYWKGYREYREKGISHKLPRMFGVQAAGAAPIVLNQLVPEPHTIATAIRIGNPASWQQANRALKESNGHIDSVTDDEIIAAYKLLASLDGVFVEPASAASIAGLIKYHKESRFIGAHRVVCTVTGHGLKDPDVAIANSGQLVTVKADKAAVLNAIGV